MQIALRRVGTAAVAASALSLVLTACGGAAEPAEPAGGAGADAAATIEVEDNHGTQTVPADAQSIIATDNRIFETLESWDVELSAAPRTLMPATSGYKDNEDILDLGNHREPDLESAVAAEPDLILNGQRFAQYREQLAELNPDVPIVELDPRDGENFGEELKRQTTVLGQIFGKESEADQLTADFDAAVERVEAAYNPDQKVLAVITSGGEINYAAPHEGRTLGAVYDMVELTPALEVDDTSGNHEGDGVSVEAIAQSNPDWILVMDRDAAVAPNNGEEYTPANELLKSSQALTDVTAVKEDNIVYMPEDTYTNEGIQTYTEFLNSIADAMEQQS